MNHGLFFLLVMIISITAFSKGEKFQIHGYVKYMDQRYVEVVDAQKDQPILFDREALSKKEIGDLLEKTNHNKVYSIRLPKNAEFKGLRQPASLSVDK